MEKPELFKHQYAVAQAEFATGHVLKKDKTLFLVGDDSKDAFEIFNSYKQAEEFSIFFLRESPARDSRFHTTDQPIAYLKAWQPKPS